MSPKQIIKSSCCKTATFCCYKKCTVVVITLQLTGTIVCRKERQKLKLSVLKGKSGACKFVIFVLTGAGWGSGAEGGDVNW